MYLSERGSRPPAWVPLRLAYHPAQTEHCAIDEAVFPGGVQLVVVSSNYLQVMVLLFMGTPLFAQQSAEAGQSPQPGQ